MGICYFFLWYTPRNGKGTWEDGGSKSVYAEGVAGEKGQRMKRAEPVYHSPQFACRLLPSHCVFSPLPPVWRLVPGYVPGALSRITTVHVWAWRNQTALQVGILKSQSRAISFQYKLFLIIFMEFITRFHFKYKLSIPGICKTFSVEKDLTILAKLPFFCSSSFCKILSFHSVLQLVFLGIFSCCIWWRQN